LDCHAWLRRDCGGFNAKFTVFIFAGMQPDHTWLFFAFGETDTSDVSRTRMLRGLKSSGKGLA
jgi:hypothetical protein